MKRQPYTNIQFNYLPGWARDHILALEREAAAAPEMLSALESLLTGSEEQWVPHDLRLIEAQKAARAAIAKAKGE